MSQLVEFSGVDDFCHGGPKDSMLLLSLGRQTDVYFPSRKRSRISAAPFVFPGEIFQQKKPEVSIDVLPDECLFEILRRLPGGQERSACAGVSKRWLMLLSTVHRDEIAAATEKTNEPAEPKKRVNPSIKKSDPALSGSKKDGIALPCSNATEAEEEVEDEKDGGFLSRCLEGKKATDLRLASVAVGTASRGGLGKLSIRGSKHSRVMDSGLKAIGRCCPSLKSLSLWNIPAITDEGLSEIAAGCGQIEKLDLSQCPGITDKSLTLIAKSCPNLISVTMESCLNIGNESLQAFGQHCPNLMIVTVKNCPLVGDQGLAGLFASAGTHLAKVKLQSLNVTDLSLAVIGHYGVALTELTLVGLQNINERGFWVMGNGQGLQKLRSLVVASCLGVTDPGVEALGKGCPNLKQICFRKCPFLSDNGAVSFVKAATSLESMMLDECQRITQAGFFGILLLSCGKLKALSFANCFGIKDLGFWNPASLSPCKSLRSLSISNCTGFNDATLAILSRICPNLVHVSISGLHSVTDHGLLQIVQNCDAGLVKVNLSGCINVSDKTVLTLAKLHGETLELLNLDGCKKVTDESLYAIAEHCSVLHELDVSKTVVSDSGIAALAGVAVETDLRILSLSGCTLLSDKCLPHLREVGSALAGLNIQGCSGISQRGSGLLVEMLWKCDILS